MARSSRGIGWAALAAAVVLAGVAGLAWWRFNRQGPEPTPADPAVEAASPRRRVAIPRPARREAEAPVATPVTPAVPDPVDPPTAATDPDPPADVPEVYVTGTGREPKDLAATLKTEIVAVTPELIACLDGWKTAQPEVFAGKATFSFHLDQQGVAEMEVLDVESVPEATLACLGDVLWEDVAWPKVETPLEVTWPVQVSVEPDP